MDNVIVTPHIASATARMAPETRRRLGREIATVLQGKWPRSAVNPGVLPRTGLIRWQPYPMGRGPESLSRHAPRPPRPHRAVRSRGSASAP